MDTVRVSFGQKYSPVAFLMLSENRPPPPSFDDLRKQWLLARLAVGVQRQVIHAATPCPGATRVTSVRRMGPGGRAARDGSRAGSSSSVFRSTERLSSAHLRLLVTCDYVSHVIALDIDGYIFIFSLWFRI